MTYNVINIIECNVTYDVTYYLTYNATYDVTYDVSLCVTAKSRCIVWTTSVSSRRVTAF